MKRILLLAIILFSSAIYAHGVTILKSETKISKGSYGGAEITRLESYPIDDIKMAVIARPAHAGRGDPD